MLDKIGLLPIRTSRKERIQEVYDYYSEHIDDNNGQYKTPILSIIAEDVFGFCGDTLRKDLDTLIEIGLLEKVGIKQAVYSKPVKKTPDDKMEEEFEDDSEPIESINDSELVPYIKKHSIVSKTERVMLDCDVGRAYNVSTREINQARARNPKKFVHPKTGKLFAWQLTDDEVETFKSQIVTKIEMRGVHKKP